MRKPYLWKARNCWYVRDGAKNIRLDPDEKKAYELWEGMRSLADVGPTVAFATLAELFLRDYRTRVSTSQYERSVAILSGFVAHLGLGVHARDIRPSEVRAWVQGRGLGKWSDRAAVQAIKQVYRWSVHEGYLLGNPIASIPLPEGSYRDTTISWDVHRILVDDCFSRPESVPFGLFLIALRHSGARPSSVAAVTRDDVVGQTWVLPDHKTRAKTGKPLVIHLDGCLATLTRLLADKYPKGPLFRNSKGRAWAKDTIVQRFERLRSKYRIEGVTAYSYRHSLATDLLVSGAGIAQVAEILGHTGTRMVSQVYGHLDQHGSHLRDVLRTRR
jgi:integrase